MSFECTVPTAVRPTACEPVTPTEVEPTTAVRTFPQGVASGGPTPTGVICWTRLDPDACRPGTPLFVEVAPGRPDREGTPVPFDPDEVVFTGRVDPPTSTHDWTVRVDLDGRLESDRDYRYRFVHDGVASPVGRCRTLPAQGASPESVSFAVLACQDYQNGYYGALGHVAREDVDFVLHLGDFIYDSADGRYRGLGSDRYPDRGIDLPSGEPVAFTLADFRTLYRTYRGDPLLAAAAAAHTSIRTWDDHAVADNRFWDYEVDAPVAPSHPRGDDPAFMRQLTADAIQAFYEYTPARVEYDPGADRLHDAFRLYRAVEFGDLLRLFVTDERLFREPPPCYGRAVPGWTPLCRERTAADRTMLGHDQRAWLTDGFRRSDTRWTGWANEVLSLPLRVGVGSTSIRPFVDSWDGYPAERDHLYGTMAGNDATAFVTLTGDLHSTLVGEQRHEDGVAGIECMTPAVTSVNGAEAVGVDEGVLGRATRPVLSGLVTAMNPELSFFDSHHWGYATATFSRDRFTFDVYAVDKRVDRADAARTRLLSRSVRREKLL